MKKNRLSSYQERFCQNVASGMSYKDSFIDAYNTENYTIESIYAKSSEMMADVKIMLRIEELRKPVIKKLEITFEKLVKELELAKEICITEDKKDLITHFYIYFFTIYFHRRHRNGFSIAG